jgi:hypothetical protein
MKSFLYKFLSLAHHSCLFATECNVCTRLIFVDKHRIRLSGKLLPNGWPQGGQQLTSQSEQRIASYNKGTKVSHVWAAERIHWESMGTTHADVERAVDQMTKNAKESASRLRLITKECGPDSQQALSAKQELFQLRREQYYWQKIEKVMRDKARGKPDAQAPTPIKVHWHAHQAEEEPARLDITSLIQEAKQDPSKVIAFGGGDPGIRVTLEGQQQTLEEVEGHLIRYRTLFGNPYSVLSGMLTADEYKIMRRWGEKNRGNNHFPFCTLLH